MYPRCQGCVHTYERAPGYFLGSIYLNYGLTAILVTAIYLSVWAGELMHPDRLLWLCTAFAVLFPLLVHRWARSFWMAMDQWFDPASPQS
jgi:hypothetical protein